MGKTLINEPFIIIYKYIRVGQNTDVKYVDTKYKIGMKINEISNTKTRLTSTMF